MRPVLILMALVLSAPAMAQNKPAKPQRPTNAPKPIGKFDDWLAVTHSEAGQPVCYAFTRAKESNPAVPGRGDVVLTVTQRTSGRDAVAISAGFTYSSGAEVQVVADKTDLQFYTAQRSAFARDGHAATVAFIASRQALAKSPGPRNATVTDTFSLTGFSAAYAAINKACPAK